MINFPDDFAPEKLKKMVTTRCDSKKNPLTPLEAVCLQIKCVLLKYDVRADLEKALLNVKTFGPTYMRDALRLACQQDPSVNASDLETFPLISFAQGAWRVKGSGKLATVVSTTYDL